MSFYTYATLREIDRVARVFYIDRALAKGWNEHHRGADDLRLLTGWVWKERRGIRSRSGFKTQSVALRDAYYVLLRGKEQPADVSRPRLVVITPTRKSA